ncbi:MAG: hypothetical protein P8Y73_04830 [Desulfuromonadales bacterium]
MRKTIFFRTYTRKDKSFLDLILFIRNIPTHKPLCTLLQPKSLLHGVFRPAATPPVSGAFFTRDKPSRI